MGINVNDINPKYNFEIISASYIGKPVNHTVMYMSKKVEHFIDNLKSVENCLIFAESSVNVPEEIQEKNCFVFTENPQASYAEFALKLSAEKKLQDKKKKYTLTDLGYYIGEDVEIGEGTIIEPGCLIGHNVKIGKNSIVKSGARIKNSIIGDYFCAEENCTIGTDGFTMANDENGHKFRIPTLGKVVIGNNVEIGAHTNVCAGTAGDTVIEDYVKIDALIHIGHDVFIKKNAEITAGAVIGGFVELGVQSYVGINAVLRNRVVIGDGAFVGMGAVVTKSVVPNITVVGNPAKEFIK